MKDVLDKLSSYNLFNYLFPGIVFSVAGSELTRYSLIQKDIVVGVFIYYFVGLVISRIGSLVIEPILRRLSFLKFTDYKDFVQASKEDDKIELSSEVNNTYRTLCSLFVLLLVLKLYERLESMLPVLNDWNMIIVASLLLILFLFSYRKQTNYVVKRIDAMKKKGVVL